MWGEYLRQPDAPDFAARMHRAESTGRPPGDEGFVKTIGRILGRDLQPKKPAPKPKRRNQENKRTEKSI